MLSDIYLSSNQLYFIALIPDTDIDSDNYSVVNADNMVVEYTCRTLPQAIGVAEQFDYMLTNNTWKDTLVDMFGPMQRNIFDDLPMSSTSN